MPLSVWRFFHTFTVPVVEKADGTYEFGCSSDEWATAVHLALAGPAKPSKKAKGDAAPGLPALAGDDAIIKAGFSVPAVYKQLKECDLSWFVLADSQGTLSFKVRLSFASSYPLAQETDLALLPAPGAAQPSSLLSRSPLASRSD